MPSLKGFAAVASKKEAQGPLAKYIDLLNDDSMFGEKTWEMAESRMQNEAANLALKKAQLSSADIQYVFAGDLLNQCISSNYALTEMQTPFFGLYGACSTMAESLTLASVFVESGAASNAMAMTSSHFCAAERQFRYPLAYGGQRTPTAQWTVTGAGACVVSSSDKAPYVKAATVGSIIDKGVKDMGNMGAAMAPAAADTIEKFLSDTNTNPSDYDLIVTGDLAYVGSQLLHEVLKLKGISIKKQHNDCGLLIYDREAQEVEAGGSGCGCAATVLCSYILSSLQQGKLKDVLFIATGALMSTVSSQQGESIPSIAHLVHLSSHK